MLRVLGYISRWIIGFSYFFVVACYIVIGLLFYKPQQLYVLLSPICRMMLRSVGVRVRFTGRNNVNAKKSYLIVVNHESLFDPFICVGYIPMYFVAVELAEQFSWPIWGKLTTLWGNIPLDRQNLTAAMPGLNAAEDALRNGKSIIIFPEGGRTTTGEMREFKKGAFYLALKTKADILPIAINGLYKAKTRGDWRVRSAKVTFNIGKPIGYDDYHDLSVGELRDLMREKILNLKTQSDEI
ncbi:MAG: lysophospholipid acyltransferase family protein [Candidatus Marinimicrobia bacterium]|nr:lysophospholipid acyltransferase family protein [Candidatus Neomarinimicrobiota bacterium]